MTAERYAAPAPSELPFVHAEQLLLPGMGPLAGERYRHRTTGNIVTVLAVTPRKCSWVTLRVMGEQQTITLAQFQRTFVRI